MRRLDRCRVGDVIRVLYDVLITDLPKIQVLRNTGMLLRSDLTTIKSKCYLALRAKYHQLGLASTCMEVLVNNLAQYHAMTNILFNTLGYD